ncbi:Integrase catalytic domain-containing protein [Aphis craccivora]|uniref:Integrase catalytic domain-containing protein n=1 Tax=Aphis craccivora TaxID=307492 RepID=A0A6G0VVB3_APHCR|nr:Integrase catalytic domain-containing protein [Aphis craccivora]
MLVLIAVYDRHYTDKKLNSWDEYLPYAFFVYNFTEHTSTGYQPYSLLFGRHLEIPKMQESHKIARENLIKRKIKSKQIYYTIENSVEIHVKDQISLRDKTQKNKLNPLWIGPYEVTDVLDRENIVILKGKRHVTIKIQDYNNMLHAPDGVCSNKTVSYFKAYPRIISIDVLKT